MDVPFGEGPLRPARGERDLSSRSVAFDVVFFADRGRFFPSFFANGSLSSQTRFIPPVLSFFIRILHAVRRRVRCQKRREQHAYYQQETLVSGSTNWRPCRSRSLTIGRCFRAK